MTRTAICKVAVVVVVGGWFATLGGPMPGLIAQETSTGRAVVTVSTKSGEGITTVPRQSISVFENRKRQEVAKWVPLRGERAGLQLAILLDDASRGNLGLQLNDIRSFVMGLPPTTRVAIGYMRNGAPNLAQNFSSDHAQVLTALRLPEGITSVNGSPYFCLSDLAKNWPGGGSDVRREVIMVTDGVDRYSGASFDPEDPYVQAAISDAQHAGIIVYTIYYRGAGSLDRNFMVTDGGQNYLTEVSSATGGKVYLEGFGNPVSFSPFLSDIQIKLQNQYELTFASTSKPGLQAIRVKTSQPNTNVDSPARVLVGETMAPQ